MCMKAFCPSVSGAYGFSLKSNDGSDLFIGGVRVVDNDRAVGYVEANGFVYLEKGCHPLKLVTLTGIVASIC